MGGRLGFTELSIELSAFVNIADTNAFQYRILRQDALTHNQPPVSRPLKMTRGLTSDVTNKEL